MNTGTILIEKKRYNFNFNQKARRLFMEKYGLQYFSEYEAKVKEMHPDPEKGMGLKELEILGSLVLTAIESVEGYQEKLEEKTLGDYLMDHPDTMAEVMNKMIASQEQPDKNTSGGPGGKSKGAK